MAEKPTVAFVLALIGGIIVIIVPFLEILRRVVRQDVIGLFIGGGLVEFILGVVWGTLMIVGAIMLYAQPQHHLRWGIIVLVFSVLSWIGAAGGLVIGFMLGLVGGILGIVWKPAAVPSRLVSPSAPSTRVCPNCGTVLYTDAKYCPKCGKELP